MSKKSENKETSEAPKIAQVIEQEKEIIHNQILAQKDFFKTGTTKSVKWRLSQLKKLYLAIKKYEKEISQALQTDLGKSDFESYLTEIGVVLHEITVAKKNLKNWTKTKKVPGEKIIKSAKALITPEPFGTILILSPWSNPFLFAMQPLVSAIASGNTVVLKTSSSCPETSKIIETILTENFEPEFILFVQSGYMQKQILMREHFDFIFFTGSKKVGTQIMENAAKNLTPVCLELGGKNPCIVDETANISLSARRIVWGKLLNAGQTCVAPDYVLVHESVKETFIKSLYDEIEVQYGENPLENPDYPKIINSKHFSRLYSLIPDAKVDTSKNKIAPTILDLGNLEDSKIQAHPTMKEEIFGPILPIISYQDVDQIVDFISLNKSPLALYLFSKNKTFKQTILSKIRSGSVCVNDVVSQFTSATLPFGGIGDSGFGTYHGEYGFKTFSHYKTVLVQNPSKEIKYRYNPHGKNLKKIKKIIK